MKLPSAAIQRMLDAVAHRAIGDTVERATYLGHGIALGVCEDGPEDSHVAHNESGTIRVVADAELSNAASLRAALDARGHELRTLGDAELIAHAYEEWGDACVERFAGPFACAIWDDMRRRLVLARDRFGIRPLCFALLHGDGVVFASELKALAQDPGVGRAWHPEAIDAYLALGYVPAPLTIHPRISKLEPAHTVVVQGRRLTMRRYWDLSSAASERASEREAIDLLESCLRASVTALCPEPDGCILLSGGIASTAVAAVSSRNRETVTVGLEDDTSDLDRIASIGAHLGLCGEIDLASVYPAEMATLLAWHFDEPTASPAAISLYAVFGAARAYAPVALTGHGACAFWGGTPRPELFDDRLRHALYTRRFSSHVRDARPLAPGANGGARASLADDDLAIADRAATATGLRLRHPYLDRDLVDLSSALPDDVKVRGSAMFALRQVAARHVPPALLSSSARPASSPAWLACAVSSLVPDVLLSEQFDTRGIFSRPAIRVLWDEHQSGRRDHTRRLWSLLMLEFWFREFIDGDTAMRPLEHAVGVRAA